MAAQTVTWDEHELAELQGARDWRHRARLEKRILHNRTAVELCKHFLEPFDVDTGLKCSLCWKTCTLARLQKFLAETCGGEVDRSTTAGVPESALNSSRE